MRRTVAKVLAMATWPKLPPRRSLTGDVAALLREQLRAGAWQQFLPSGRTLADQLQVSRITLREALEILRREGRIRIAHGARTRITGAARTRTGLGSRRVTVLSISPLHELPPYDIFLIGELRRYLHDAGYELDVHSNAHLKWTHPQSLLEQVVKQARVGVWILLTQGAIVQRWFAQRNLPAIILGSCHAGIRLPSFDLDYRAICRHAVGVCLRAGHRHIALAIPSSGLAGDLASELGFLEGFQGATHRAAAPVLLRHDGTLAGIRAALKPVVVSKNRPTAILVSHTRDFLTVLTCLLHAGIRVPGDVSLISREDDEFFAHIHPSVARYVASRAEYARRVARATVRLAAAGSLPPRSSLIMAQFQQGETLAGPPRLVQATSQ
ncbi:MAG: LacI family DNA-binding transcriptional regulator [Verrucomicrobia bacterium]|nr:LacI family DNA-binding transcriptional regulator [Verrucomicrobiota bacterium]